MLYYQDISTTANLNTIKYDSTNVKLLIAGTYKSDLTQSHLFNIPVDKFIYNERFYYTSAYSMTVISSLSFSQTVTLSPFSADLIPSFGYSGVTYLTAHFVRNSITYYNSVIRTVVVSENSITSKNLEMT